jgi:hypothetical protein
MSNATNSPSAVQPTGQISGRQQLYAQNGPMQGQGTAQQKPGRNGPLANGWGNFEAQIQHDDAMTAAKVRQDRDRIGDSFRPEIRETYKDQRGQAQSTLHDKVAGSSIMSEGNMKKDELTKPFHELQQGSGPRASRFFPRPSEQPQPMPVNASTKADSPPPPPETATHPAFTGDTSHPLVRLPKPSPIVRLPPSSSGHDMYQEPVVNMPPGGRPLGARSSAIAMNPEWQARFNKLLEKPGLSSVPEHPQRPATSAGPVTPSKAPAALSKDSLDVRGNVRSATVSLPSTPLLKTFSDDRGRDNITRKDTEVLFEDREFGSRPTVRVSKTAHLAANLPASKTPPEEVPMRFKRFENPFTMRRLEAFDLEKVASKIDVVIRMPRMRGAITKSMPRKRRGFKSTIAPKLKQHPNLTNVAAGTSKERPRKPLQQSDRIAPSRPSQSNTWTNTSASSTPRPPTSWAQAASVH